MGGGHERKEVQRTITRDTPLPIASLQNSTGTLSKWSGRSFAGWLAVCDRGQPPESGMRSDCGMPHCRYYVQHLSRCTPGRTECIGRDGRYIQDTCGIFVPCHYRPCPAVA